ncbi:MAG: hypothetical protein ACRERE_21530 [Candidatus Entotheonellia bacterium]
MAVRVQEPKLRECLSAAIHAPSEMVGVPAIRRGACVAADDTWAVLG